MTDFDKAMRDPTLVFKQPSDVLADKSLSKEQKIKILTQWEYDARELSVAEEENMPAKFGDEANMLNRIHEALRTLGVSNDHQHHSKH